MTNMAIVNAIILLAFLFIISWLFLLFVIYFIPLIVAHIRKHKNIVAIAILNIVVGWTFIGWLAALLWALNCDTVDDNQG